MAFLLVHTTDSTKTNRGEIASIRETATFGGKERLPNWLRVEVVGVSKFELEAFADRWKTGLKYTEIEGPKGSWRIKIEIDPILVEKAGVNSEIPESLREFINSGFEGLYQVAEVAFTGTELLVDIVQPDGTSLNEVLTVFSEHYRDTLQSDLGIKKYKFSDAEIDFATSRGQFAEESAQQPDGKIPSDLVHHIITQADFLSRIENRLS